MTGRRKGVPCLLCKEITFDKDAICMGCRHAYQTGKKNLAETERARGEGEKIRIDIPVYVRLTPSSHVGQIPYSTYEIHSPLWKALLDIFNFERLERFGSTDRKVGFVPGQDAYSSDCLPVLASPEQADRLEALVTLIRALAAGNYRDGYRSGSDMLGRLANGDLTVEQLTKLK